MSESILHDGCYAPEVLGGKWVVSTVEEFETFFRVWYMNGQSKDVDRAAFVQLCEAEAG